MEQKVRIQEDRWMMAAEAAWGDAALDPAVVELRAELDRWRRAMASRAVIDQACGMVMALTPCRRGAAWAVLAEVARQSDFRLREVAAALVATTEGDPFPRHLDPALRRALRRVHASPPT